MKSATTNDTIATIINNNDNNDKIIYIFNDIDTSCIAAIEYVIYKYKDKEWFNAALYKVVTDIYKKNRKDICQLPLYIIKLFLENEKILLVHRGYHYIIHQIEIYARKYK